MKSVMVFNKGSGAMGGTPKRPTLTEEVEAEVAKHPGVIAFVDEAKGRVTTYMVPKKPVPRKN